LNSSKVLSDYYGKDSKARAVIIGINNYENHGPLPNCLNDASEVKSVLERNYGFTNTITFSEKESTKKNIDRLLESISSDHNEFSDNVRLVFFFSGHGRYKKNYDRDGNHRREGFIIPIEAEKNYADYVSFESITKAVVSSHLRSILLIFDSCYSGYSALKVDQPSLPLNENDLENITKNRAVEVFAATMLEEPATGDHLKPGYSDFTAALLEVLLFR